jgi:hypothetical protein
VPTRDVRDVLEQLVRLRERHGTPPPWLFRPDPVWPGAHPDERPALAALEARAAECDRMGGEPGSLGPEPAVLLRRAVLADLERVGLLAARDAGPKLIRLLGWDFTHLAEWYEAVLAATRYLASPGRRRYLPEAQPEPVRAGPVCLDLFRGGLVVPETVEDPNEWVAWGEWLLSDRPHGGEQGEFLHHDQDGWVRVRWRRDHPDRAGLLALAVVDRPGLP